MRETPASTGRDSHTGAGGRAQSLAACPEPCRGEPGLNGYGVRTPKHEEAIEVNALRALLVYVAHPSLRFLLLPILTAS